MGYGCGRGMGGWAWDRCFNYILDDILNTNISEAVIFFINFFVFSITLDNITVVITTDYQAINELNYRLLPVLSNHLN